MSPRITIVAILLACVACDDTVTDPPALELYIDGTLSVTGPTIAFSATRIGQSATATFELKNLGPGDVELTSHPPLQIERDDRLAFRVVQPESPRIRRGETLTITTRFVPTAAGPSTARLVIAAAHLAEPLMILLTGQGQAVTAGELTVTFDGASPPARYDFGAVPVNSAKSVTLRLENTGTAALSLGDKPLTLGTLAGDTADLAAEGGFALGPFTDTALAPGQVLSVPVTFAPRRCGAFAASLTVAIPNATTWFIELRGTGGDNPRRVPNATDTTQLRAPDLALAVSDALAGGEKRRVAIGNLTVGAFSGQVATFGWDGCVTSENRVLSATASGLTATLFGNTVALSDDGRLMLVTGRDQRRDAWLFALDPDGTARLLTTLLSTHEAFGHGRGAALAGDGSVALIGQTGASNGINTHGAVFVYERGAAWGEKPDYDLKLVPSLTSGVELVGGWVDASTSADVVVAGALGAAAGSPTPGPVLAFLWSRADDTWGLPGDEVVRERHENIRLVTDDVPGDSAARVAVSGDGALVALGVAGEGHRIYLYVRDGDTWGLETAALDERAAHAVLSFADRPVLRFTVSAAGDVLVVGDDTGVLELDRPDTGWVNRTVTTADRTWSTPMYGRPALSPDGKVLVGVGPDGAAWLIAR